MILNKIQNSENGVKLSQFDEKRKAIKEKYKDVMFYISTLEKYKVSRIKMSEINKQLIQDINDDQVNTE